jgi:4-amino-4-deoxy-L-arabinose transferase-like glycosyltransferase
VSDRSLAEFARGPVCLAAAASAIVLTATSNRYGYHRDELYFRMLHPGWGYFDEPPLTPLLVHGFSRLIADEPWAIRIPATLAMVLSMFVLVLITRELGGGRQAQSLCAWGYSFAALPLVMGHVLLTSSIDLPVWPAVLLFAIRALLRREPRWWIWCGVVVGLSTYNKLLVAVLLVAMAAGLALAGPRRVLWSKWVLGGLTAALLIGLPNLVYQATHGWPQLAMGRALASNNAGSVRIQMWPFLVLILGPPLVPIWCAGLVSLVRRPDWRQIRFIAPAFPVLLVLVFVMGAQFYYPFGLLAVLFAIGCVPTADWMTGWRTRLTVVGVGLNAAVSLVLALPLIPLSVLGDTPVPGINQVAQDSVGWPTYVREIAAVYETLPAPDRRHAVVVTSNYGEAGAVDRYGAAYRLPAVYSGQNQLYYQARPPTGATSVIFVGGEFGDVRTQFASCSIRASLDNRENVDNEEQGEPIAVCRDPVGGWSTVWPHIKHED